MAVGHDQGLIGNDIIGIGGGHDGLERSLRGIMLGLQRRQLRHFLVDRAFQLLILGAQLFDDRIAPAQVARGQELPIQIAADQDAEDSHDSGKRREKAVLRREDGRSRLPPHIG